MVNNHLCSESCYIARTADKLTISCFVCEKKCNSKCFDLSSQQTMKALSPASNAVFMCYKCIDRVTRLKQNHRKSNDATTARSSTRNNDQTHHNQNDLQQDQSILSTILSTIKAMEEKFSLLLHSNDEMKQSDSDAHRNSTDLDFFENEFSKVNSNIANLHAKFDHDVNTRSRLEKQNNVQIMEKLNEMNTRTPCNKLSTKNVNVHNESNTRFKDASLPTNPLDWSFSFTQPAMHNDNSELYQLLHGFERNTWTSFDYIRQKLQENTDAVIQIRDTSNDSSLHNMKRQLGSPVLDSITLDNLQMINDKCDNIEKNLRELDLNIKSLHIENNDDGEMTQQLRDRFIKIIDDDNISYTGTGDQNEQTYSREEPLIDATKQSNSSTTTQFPVIGQRLPNVNTSNATNISGKHDFYVTKFSPNTTANMIENFLSNNGVNDLSSTDIKCLIPRGKDRSTLNFVSFKITTDDAVAKVITSVDFWPDNCTIKNFVHKSIVDIANSSSHFFRMPSDQTKLR